MLKALDVMSAAAREAGQAALTFFQKPHRVWTKDGGSPVTEADHAANEVLFQRLSGFSPDIGWLSEETPDTSQRLTCSGVWVVDPIDGTRAFTHGQPDWTICVALVMEGIPVAGVVYAPVSDELFSAARGLGCRHNGALLKLPSPAPDRLRVTGSKRMADMLADGFIVETVPKIYSLALRLCRVADGSCDVAFATADAWDWDLAAADVIAREAGALLADADGKSPVYNQPLPRHPALMCAPARLHKKLNDFILRHPSSFRS